jgi:6-phosphogluconate dehydrogenase
MTEDSNRKILKQEAFNKCLEMAKAVDLIVSNVNATLLSKVKFQRVMLKKKLMLMTK